MATLKNGSTLIFEILTPDGSSVVLASTERDFVTWWKNDEGDCSYGHYYQQTLDGFKEAILDFFERAGV